MMSELGAVSLLAMLIVLVLSSIMILWCDYSDGLVGKTALIVLALGALANLTYVWEGAIYQPLPSTVATHVGFAVFFCRHFFRFMKFRHRGTFRWER